MLSTFQILICSYMASFTLPLFLTCLYEHSFLVIPANVFLNRKKLTVMFSDRENIKIDIQLHFSKKTCSCTNANHFFTQSVYYHIHTSYLFYRLQIPLWWILLFVLCYISTVMPLEITMTLVSESFSCYLFQQEKTRFFFCSS